MMRNLKFLQGKSDVSFGHFQEMIERGVRSGELETIVNAKALHRHSYIRYRTLTVMMKSRPERSFY